MGNRDLTRALAVATLVFALDRITKFWVITVLDLPTHGFIPVVDPWFNLTMAWNPGINFGLFDMGAGGQWLLIALALAIILGLLFWLRRSGGWLRAIGVGAIIGGALGNVWDRVKFGAVADFLNVTCCGLANPYAFNIADAAIFGGALLLVLFSRDNPDESRNRA